MFAIAPRRRGQRLALLAALLAPRLCRAEGAAAPESLHALQTSALRLFVDCADCGGDDFDYIRAHLACVNHVRDRNSAQVHVLVTMQPTGGDGTEATVAFIGREEFTGVDDTLKLVFKASETDEVMRRELVRVLGLGLVRYVAHTPLAGRVTVSYADSLPAGAKQGRDPWDNWVFSTNLEGTFNGQSSQRFISTYGSLSASRVTLGSKVSVSVSGNYNESRFDLGESGRVLSISRGQSARGRYVRSLGDHWSAAVRTSVYKSTYDNMDLNLGVGPAVECDIFPYSQSTRRQLRCSYRVAYQHADYDRPTLFGKTAEHLFQEELSVTLNVKEPWGSAEVSLEGSNYLHDLGKNRLQAWGSQSFRVLEGLSLRLQFNASRVRDQLSLAAAGATAEEILLQRRQLATQYEYWANMGLSYTFGSIYNNVVNARFGN